MLSPACPCNILAGAEPCPFISREEGEPPFRPGTGALAGWCRDSGLACSEPTLVQTKATPASE